MREDHHPKTARFKEDWGKNMKYELLFLIQIMQKTRNSSNYFHSMLGTVLICGKIASCVYFIFMKPAVLRGADFYMQNKSTGCEPFAHTDCVGKHSHPHSDWGAIECSPVNLTCMFLECWSKLEYPGKTHTSTMRTCGLHTKTYAETPAHNFSTVWQTC